MSSFAFFPIVSTLDFAWIGFGGAVNLCSVLMQASPIDK